MYFSRTPRLYGCEAWKVSSNFNLFSEEDIDYALFISSTHEGLLSVVGEDERRWREVVIGNPWRMHRLRYELGVASRGFSGPAVTCEEREGTGEQKERERQLFQGNSLNEHKKEEEICVDGCIVDEKVRKKIE